MWKFSSHESLHGAGNLISILGLWESCLHNLVNDGLSVWVLWDEHLTPKLFILSLDKISCLHSEEVTLVGDFNKLFVTLSPCSLVSCKGKIWVSFFAVFSNNLGVVVLIIDKEVLWVLVNIDIDLGDGVMESWLLDSLVTSLL
jgi:hypothetical protein